MNVIEISKKYSYGYVLANRTYHIYEERTVPRHLPKSVVRGKTRVPVKSRKRF